MATVYMFQLFDAEA